MVFIPIQIFVKNQVVNRSYTDFYHVNKCKIQFLMVNIISSYMHHDLFIQSLSGGWTCAQTPIFY